MLKRFNNLSVVAGRFNIGRTHVLDIMALTFDRVGRLAAVGGTFGEGRATLFESGEKIAARTGRPRTDALRRCLQR
jgi:hypothetical protein